MKFTDRPAYCLAEVTLPSFHCFASFSAVCDSALRLLGTLINQHLNPLATMSTNNALACKIHETKGAVLG